MKQFSLIVRQWFTRLLLVTLISGSSLLVACGDTAATAVVAPNLVLPTATTPPLPTNSPTPQPTPTIAPIASTEWGSVKSTGTEVKAAPDNSSATLEKLNGFTIVAWQRKLVDESWLERAGGGWVQRRDIVIYGSEAEARRSVPQLAASITPLPSFNPNPATIGPAKYTYGPVVGPGAVPQVLTTRPAPATSPAVVAGITPATTATVPITVFPTTTPIPRPSNLPTQGPPTATLRPGVTPPPIAQPGT